MSSLIVLGIVGIWILVLVPMWLNRHDADNAARSMDSFSTAMRVLSRRPQAQAARRTFLMPRRHNLGVTVDNQPQSKSGRRLPRLPHLPLRRPTQARGGAAGLVVRKRRIALAFVVLMIGLAASAAVFHTSWWLELAVDLGAAGYLVHLRNGAIRAAELRRRRTSRTARAVSTGVPAGVSVRREYVPAREERFDDVSVAVAAPLTPAVVASASGTENGSRWEPVPVPLPTYVSKPVMPRVAVSAPRADVESGTIDLTRPGAWTDSQVDVRYLLLDETGSATISASAGAPRPHAPADAVEDDELDVILARRRAVND